MRPYGIARYLSKEQIDRALAAEYRLTDGWVDRVGRMRQALWTTDGRRACPLGVALELRPTPNQYEVEYVLAPSAARSRAERLRIRQAAFRFIRANDSGKITPENLPAALGRPRS